jgi:hypothetical protein
VALATPAGAERAALEAAIDALGASAAEVASVTHELERELALATGAPRLLHVQVTGEPAGGGGADDEAETSPEPRAHRLPFLGEAARERGYELPLTYGAGGVYYYLSRAIEVSDVRVGRNGATPESVSDFAQLASSSEVDNVNVKLDVWILPFLNVYAIAGYASSETAASS